MKKPSLVLILCFAGLACLSPAQKIVGIKRGSPDSKAIIELITPYANAHSVRPIRVFAEAMRRCGDWAFVASTLKPVNGKDQGDTSLIALLKKGRRWTIREISAGNGKMGEVAADWEKKHKLPAGLVELRAKVEEERRPNLLVRPSNKMHSEDQGDRFG